MDAQPSSRYAWYVVSLLTLANISSFIDRQILSLLVKPIKYDLHLSDTQMSLLMGLSFALFYTVFGMVIGRLADRYSRRNIVIGGINVWSLMTVLCGGVRTYPQFFLVRMGVGVGEATLSPSAFSMIADLFPKKRLATALSIFSMGIFLGSGLATLIGSGIVAKLPTAGLVTLPVFGTVFPWQLLFLYVGIPGLVIGLLLFTIREPRRTNLLQVDGATVLPSFAESLRLVFRYRTAYLLICFTTACQALINYGCSAWVPTFVARTYGWEVPRAGAFFGLVTIVASLLGVVFGGWYADKLTREGLTDGRLRVGVLSACLALCGFFIPLLPKAEWALLAMAIPIFGLACPFGAAAAAIQELMPNQARGLASAIYLFILNLIGIGLGPTLVALFTDFVFRDESMIRYSLVLLYGLGGGMGLVLGLLALKPYRQAIDSERRASQPAILS
ncbi:spinster family MFS transporter [Fibrella aquatilis]|uniref:MFS transporter n=1 Tax=Fibrella aquatilis TaxID=2817059 RepID=A0A939JXI9_9BACT|nr:MFS transporter [Fibrella aquatilis]MBO0929378.1 MFS transporter [Fibrella aquatilis]